MITAIKSKGYFIEECGLEGESKADECFPGQHNTIQLRKDRWFVIYETRGFRGSDDNRSVVGQVRRDRPDGPVLSERWLDRAIQHWDPLGDGSDYVKLCNHSVAFGVPEGALVGGHRVPHEGVFVATWRANPRVLDRDRDYLYHESEIELPREAYRSYWMQFRLNEAGDDIEILQPVKHLRQRGYESGEQICQHPDFATMNQGYVVPVAYNEDRSEWVHLLHWGEGVHELHSVCTVALFRWNADSGLYDWAETGPILDGPGEYGVFEGGIAPYGDEWVVSARPLPRTLGNEGNIWFRTGDLMGPAPEGVFSKGFLSNCPRTTYCFPDGVVRVCTTDQANSPYASHPTFRQMGDPRVPLDLLDIDPENDYSVTGLRVIFDSIKEGLPIAVEAAPTNHFCRLLPHMGGNKGYLTYNVRPRGLKHPKTAGRDKGLLKPEEARVAGVYYSEITYDREYPAMWEFGEGRGKGERKEGV